MNVKVGRLVGISIGRDWAADMDCRISVGFWFLPRPNPWEIPVAHGFSLGWNWLPQRTYRCLDCAPWYAVSSCGWTGRRIELVAIHWRDWRHYFHWF